jgi:hypothetical protein
MKVLLALLATASLLLPTTTLPQQPERPMSHDNAVPAQREGTGGMCIPAEDRAGRRYGCFVIATVRLGKLPSPELYWYIDRYLSRAAAENERGPRSTGVESYGSIWMFSIADKDFLAAYGEHLAKVGPLPLG